MAATNFQLGSARVSRCQAHRPEREPSLDSIMLTEAGTETKDCFGVKPKPARETHALPGGVNR
jgi:hypothetical protein